MCLFFLDFYVLFLFLGGDVLELFRMGSSTAFFVRAKTSRHFSGAPVYISLLFFFAIIIIICIWFDF